MNEEELIKENEEIKLFLHRVKIQHDNYKSKIKELEEKLEKAKELKEEVERLKKIIEVMK